MSSDDDVLDFSPLAGEKNYSVKPADLSPFGEAEYYFESGQYELCREKLSELWLRSPYDQPVIALYARLLKELGQDDSAVRLRRLSEALTLPGTPYKHHQEIFEAGYAMVDTRQHRVAAMLLTELTKELPDDELVNYELGFTLMCLKQYESAARHFQKALAASSTTGGDFDILLNLCVCHTLSLDVSSALAVVKELEGLDAGEDEKREIAHRRVVLKRLSQTLAAKGKRPLDDRDWLYILYGSILLRPGRLPAGRVDLKHIASTIVVLKIFLAGFSVEEEAVEYYSLRSRPLARVFGEMTGYPTDAYRGPDRPDKCLLMMAWTSDIIGPHQVFVPNTETRGLFSYALSPDEPLPVIPDIVAFVAGELIMPWEGKEHGRDLDNLMLELERHASNLEADPDLIKEAQDAIDYYEEKRDNLVFGNPQTFELRPEYTAELPGA